MSNRAPAATAPSMSTVEADDYKEVPTSLVTFVATEHGRQRRRQRGIDRRDLQSARKHGHRRPSHPRLNGNPTAVYTYKDIVYVVDEATKEEVTSYSKPLTLDLVPITADDQTYNRQQRVSIKSTRNFCNWTSNTVIVVDTSGSMKSCDVWGTRTRLGAVWVAVALDFVAHRLESGDGLPTDVISIVSLGPHPQILVEEEPLTWALYNTIVNMYNQNTVPPKGHGPYLPCLELAEALLTRNSNTACAVSLVFLSDGKPSDRALMKGCTRNDISTRICDTVEALAKQFGRRLTFSAIGIGDMDDFDMLQKMVEAAKDYGVIANFQRPSSTCLSLGNLFTSVATSITSTKTEMTDLNTGKQQQVRSVNRESRKKANQCISTVSKEDFWIYPKKGVKRMIYNEWYEGRKRCKSYEKVSLQHPEAEYVAFSKCPFGEGAERFAYRFYELAADGETIVGQPLVAKESRLVVDQETDTGADAESRWKFASTFCSTQQLARRLADKFNQKLERTRRVHPDTPSVSFLNCSIYKLRDVQMGEMTVLVEEKLEHDRWHKWNSNNGFVEGMKSAPTFTDEALASVDLGIIEEGSEEEDEDDEEEDSFLPKMTQIRFSASEVAQAFSHFTYLESGRKRLVCDLQGVFDEASNSLKFSDPVIHYHNRFRMDRRRVHGRTDRGIKGIQTFFKTHHEHHGHLCRLATRGFYSASIPNRRDTTKERRNEAF